MSDHGASQGRLAELIWRLEKATHSNFALECEIAKAIGREMMPPPAYTASIDAALTLVPEDWFVCMLQENSAHHWFCGMHTNRHAKQVHSEFAFKLATRTAPIAICIAALRARQSSTDTVEDV